MTITIEDKDFVRELEALQYDFQAHRDMIAFILTNDMDTSTFNFSKYQQDYMLIYKQYNEKKQELSRRFIIPVYPQCKNWNLDFATGVVTAE